MKNEKIMRDANHAMTGWQLHICLISNDMIFFSECTCMQVERKLIG